MHGSRLYLRIPVAPPRGERGLKLLLLELWRQLVSVAPPRGERGLKFFTYSISIYLTQCRSPSWGARIEIHSVGLPSCTVLTSLPLVGSED